MQLMHIYQLLPYVLSTSFSTHPKRLTWDKKRPPFTFFGTMRLTGNFEKKIRKEIRKFFSQFLVFWELLLSPGVEKVAFESFWALDMAPTWPFPACSTINERARRTQIDAWVKLKSKKKWNLKDSLRIFIVIVTFIKSFFQKSFHFCNHVGAKAAWRPPLNSSALWGDCFETPQKQIRNQFLSLGRAPTWVVTSWFYILQNRKGWKTKCAN